MYNDRPTIIANWKMNPTNYADVIDLFNLYCQEFNSNRIDPKFNLIVAPPTMYLFPLFKFLTSQNLNQKLNSIFLSGQNFCCEPKGAFTGDTSIEMLQDLGIKFSILGHSECRKYYKETDEIIAIKMLLALQSNIIPIVCIGETQEQFVQGDKVIKAFLKQQLLVVIKKIENLLNNIPSAANAKNKINKFAKCFFIAYEPVWAIGNGANVDVNYIQQNIDYIQHVISSYLINKIDSDLKYYILYGGSVNHNNAKELFKIRNLGGVLVGGASLKFEQFKEICANA